MDLQGGLEVPEKNKRMRLAIKISGLVVSVSGDYFFRVKLKNPQTDDFEVCGGSELQIGLI